MEETTTPLIQAPEPPSGPVVLVAALRAAHAALDAVSVLDDNGAPAGWAPLDEDPEVLAEVIRLAARLEGRTSGLKLHVVAAAELANAAEVVAATDTGAWAAKSAGGCRTREWGRAWLGTLLQQRYHHVAGALARGELSEEHAVIIVRAAQRVPETVSDADLAACEAILVANATSMTPRNLRRAARRLLEPLGKTPADELEQQLLVEDEERAERDTWFEIYDNEDGTYGGRFVIPTLHGELLAQALERLTAPRRHGRSNVGEPVTDPTITMKYGTLGEGRGLAFCELIEHLPTDGHARSGITMVVHVDEETLRTRVGAATLATGSRISADQALRLACEAGQMPMVMGGKSLPLHLGSSSRLFTKAQWVALSALHETCAAEGCLRPYHRRIHDDHDEHRRTPTGEIRFRHRWPSRRRPDRDDRSTWAA